VHGAREPVDAMLQAQMSGIRAACVLSSMCKHRLFTAPRGTHTTTFVRLYNGILKRE